MDGQFWFINKSGEIVCGSLADIGNHPYLTVYPYYTYFEGYTGFYEDGYWGYLDINGNVMIPPVYKAIRPFKNQVALVQTKEEQWIYVNTMGEKINDAVLLDTTGNGTVPFTIPEKYALSELNEDEEYKYGLILVDNLENGNIGCCDLSGNVLFEAQALQDIKIYDKQHIAVKSNDLWGVINIY